MGSRINGSFRLRYWPAWLVFLLGLTTSGGLGWRQHQQALILDKLRLARIASSVLDDLDSRVKTTDLILRNAQAYFSSQMTLTEPIFHEWCGKYGWSVTAPWIQGVLLCTNSATSAWRDSFPGSPEEWTQDEIGRFKKLAYTTQIKLEPAFGYTSYDEIRLATNDLDRLRLNSMRFSHTNRQHDTLDRAIAYNTPQTTLRQHVAELSNGRHVFGAAIAVPVYACDRDTFHQSLGHEPKPRDSQCFNWNLCRGLILAAVDYVKLEATIWGEESKEVAVEIYASAEPRADQWLNPTGQPARALDPAFKPYLTEKVPWKLYTRDWSLFVYTLPAFEAASPRYMASITFAAGAGLTLLASTLVGVALRARHRQERMTADVLEARDALAAAEKEREQFSHDLHDGAIQSLYAVQLGLGRIAQQLPAESTRAPAELTAARAELDAVIAEMRKFVRSRNGGTDAVDLSAVLRALVQRTHAGTTAQIVAQCDPTASDRLSDSQAVQLANIAREALSNSLRHGQPQRVEVVLRSEPDFVTLEIWDDGTGFDPQSTALFGVGRTSMAKRTEELRGVLDIQSRHGGGTRVVVRVPAPPA